MTQQALYGYMLQCSGPDLDTNFRDINDYKVKIPRFLYTPDPRSQTSQSLSIFCLI